MATNYRTFHVLLLVFIGLQCMAEASAQESDLFLMTSPESVRLSESTQPMDSTSVADFLSLTLGYSLPKAFQWPGVTAITDVFSLAKACVTVRLSGHHDIQMQAIKRIPIVGAVHHEWDLLSHRTEQRFAANERLIFRMEDTFDANSFLDSSAEQRLSNGLKRKEIQELVTIGDTNDDNIKAFVLELETIYEILDSLKTSNKLSAIRGLFSFDISSFDAILSDQKYEESVRRETRRLVSELIQNLTQDFRRIYGDKVVVAVFQQRRQSPHLVRNTRDTKASITALHLAHVFDANFHSAFAMTAFTALLMAVLVYGIAVAMWHIDPGKDSIIYRMTSQRIKKDQ